MNKENLVSYDEIEKILCNLEKLNGYKDSDLLFDKCINLKSQYEN